MQDVGRGAAVEPARWFDDDVKTVVQHVAESVTSTDRTKAQINEKSTIEINLSAHSSLKDSFK